MNENFGFVVPHEAQTEEERIKGEEEKKVKKAEWLKKTKKKAKTEDEDGKDMEDVR
jgi:hypothetical protein